MIFQHLLTVVYLQAWIGRNTGYLLQDNEVLCPVNCSCQSNAVDCSNRSLLSVPLLPMQNSHCSFDLSNNLITTVLSGAFSNQSKCKTCDINFDNNIINSIGDGAFDELMNSTLYLYLRNNNLTYLPSAFRNLANIYTLFLNGNPLKTLDTAIMVNIGHSLKYFEFDLGHFDSWPHQLQYLRVLDDLKIDHIPFDRIPDDAFHGLEHTLTSLSIYESQLGKIPQAFCILKNLEFLNFSSNHKLDERNSPVVESCPTNRLNIERLVFENNDVEIFPEFFKMFQSISSLLRLKSNRLTLMIGDTLASENFTAPTLDLSRNNFSRIPYAVNYLTTIRRLSFAYNSITSIDEPDISKLVNIEALDLRGNPLMYISHRSFQNNLKLMLIDLGETRLRQVPSAVQYLTNLYSLKVDHDPIECTCDMSYLKTWNITDVISDASMCFLSTEKIKDYLSQFLPLC